jgi:DNA-binding response OmpR family regulator
MKAIAIVGSTDQSQTLLADLLHWHGLSAFKVDEGRALLPLLSFISPELIVVESLTWTAAEAICARIKRSPVLSHLPVIICAERGSTVGTADAYVCSPYTAEDVFENVQAFRPLSNALSDNRVARFDS